MSEPLSFTGERFLPTCSGEIWLEHWHRYAFASQYASGLRVLDVACGEGYGSHLLAQQGAEMVVGVDISPAAACHAGSRYGDRASFIVGSCAVLPFPDQSFDRVVSFETIEHISAEDQERMLAEIRRVLKPGGLFILSSPNKKTYSDDRQYHNEFHLKELYRDELDSLLSPYFPATRWLGQKLVFNSVIWPDEGELGNCTDWLQAGETGIERMESFPAEAMYFLVFCGQNQMALPAKETETSLLLDSADVVYRDYEKSIRQTLHLDTLLLERERLIVERDRQLEMRTTQLLERENMIAERDALLDLRTAQMTEQEGLIEARDGLLILRAEQIDVLNRLTAENEVHLEELKQALSNRSSWRWWIKHALGLVR
ncbi:MAG: class I SAM-dependent methyltransferase [Sulfuricellaceae bacterium]|nr:class I SAM-dependent methyltransferase [Sulfuricellaceae bacterium]